MCLAVPGKIIRINDNIAILDYGSEKREADCSLIDCNVGDYVIVSNKIVIDKVSKQEAESSLRMYNDAINKKEE